MKWRNYIWMSFAWLLVCSCVPDVVDSPKLGITIEFPEFSDTKTDVGESPASAAENEIHDLKIWVFNHNTHILEASLDTKSDFPEGGGVRKYALAVSTNFAVRKPNVDVFVLVNSESIGYGDLNEKSAKWGDWKTIYEAAFGGDYFSPSPDKRKTTVPSKGLPMSGMAMELGISGQEPSFTLPTVSVGRAVSKLRYVFCQMKTENNSEETYAIDSVVLDKNLIPLSQYVFSENGASRIKKNTEPIYYSRTINTPWPTGKQLAQNEAPEALSYAGQDGPTYDALIKEAIQNGKLTDMGSLYLRESDKALTGTVYYSITKTGEEPEKKEMRFSMNAPGDFARNHTWTLYGYFISNRTLQLGVSALPWDKSNYTIEFSTSSLQVTHKFTVDANSATVVPIGNNHYNVYLKANGAAQGYIYITTPQGGKLEIIPEGTKADIDAFSVSPTQATIDPSTNSGRIDIKIDRNTSYEGDPSGCTITLSFKAYTPDGDREISGASECVDQIYHFIL